MERMLLHTCCAPCAIPALEQLKNSDFCVTCYYFNPNICPSEEYFKRLTHLQRVCKHYEVELIYGNYCNQDFLDAINGYQTEREGGVRCEICFNLRLKNTAIYAKQNGFHAFCTTLTTGTQKNSATINKIGQKIATEQEIFFATHDFKKKNGNLISKQVCQKLDIYRQTYCGCVPNV